MLAQLGRQFRSYLLRYVLRVLEIMRQNYSFNAAYLWPWLVQIAEAALSPNTASPRTEPEPVDRTNMYIAAGVTGEFFVRVFYHHTRTRF